MSTNYTGDNMNNNLGEDFLKKDPVPSLTFEPDFDESSDNTILKKEEEIIQEPEDNILSPEEKRMVDDFVEKIDLNN